MEQRVQRLFGGSACAQNEGPKLKGRGAVCKEALGAKHRITLWL